MPQAYGVILSSATGPVRLIGLEASREAGCVVLVVPWKEGLPQLGTARVLKAEDGTEVRCLVVKVAEASAIPMPAEPTGPWRLAVTFQPQLMPTLHGEVFSSDFESPTEVAPEGLAHRLAGVESQLAR